MCSGSCSREGALSFGCSPLLSRWKQACSLSGVGKTCPHPWRWPAAHTTLGKAPVGSGQSLPAALNGKAWEHSGSLACCLSQHSCMYRCVFMDFYFYFSRWVVIHSHHYLFGHWEPLQVGSCVLLTYHHHSLSIFFLAQDVSGYISFLQSP